MPYRAVHSITREARGFADAHRLMYWLEREEGLARDRDLPATIDAQAGRIGASGEPLIIGDWEIYDHNDPAWALNCQPSRDGVSYDGIRVYDTADGLPASS